MSNNSVNIAADNGVALKQCWHIVHWTFASKCQRIQTKIQKFSFGGNSIGNICHIARIAPMSFQTSIPHKPRQVRCTLQWLLSGHQHVFISYSQDYIKRQLKKTSNRRSSQLNQYLPYNPPLRYRPYEVTIPLGWASEGDRAPRFRQRILLFLRCHLTVPHGSGQSRVMIQVLNLYGFFFEDFVCVLQMTPLTNIYMYIYIYINVYIYIDTGAAQQRQEVY